MAQARSALRADLDDLRDRVADLKADRQSVASAVCDREEAESRIASLIEAAMSQALFDQPELFRPDDGQLGAYFNCVLGDHPFEALATLCPDAHHPGKGIGSDKRAARLEQLDRDLSAAEIAEETACREFEEVTGTSIPRPFRCEPRDPAGTRRRAMRTT